MHSQKNLTFSNTFFTKGVLKLNDRIYKKVEIENNKYLQIIFFAKHKLIIVYFF